MKNLQYSDILPGIGIGEIKIRMGEEDLKKVIKNYSVDELTLCYIYEIENIKIWVSKNTKKVSQVLVKNNFKERFLNKFGVGSYLPEIEEALGEKAKDNYDVYVFESVKGICFELEDIDEEWGDEPDWFEKHAPIEFISVFDVNKYGN